MVVRDEVRGPEDTSGNPQGQSVHSSRQAHHDMAELQPTWCSCYGRRDGEASELCPP